MRCDQLVSAPEEMSRDELIVLLAARDAQIVMLSRQVSDLVEANKQWLRNWPSWNICCLVTVATRRLRRRRMMV
jgi:hypothetical protein